MVEKMSMGQAAGKIHGFAIAKEFHKALRFAQSGLRKIWQHELGKGLRDIRVVSGIDQGNVMLFTILAEMDALRGNEAGAREGLLKARERGLKFNAHRSTGPGRTEILPWKRNATSYDDIGGPADKILVLSGRKSRQKHKRNRELGKSSGHSKDGCLIQPAPGGIINTMHKIWRFT